MDRVRVVVVCMLGAVIGGLIALNIHSYFWWIGMIVGGFAAYIFCEPKETLSAIQIAWKTVIGLNRQKLVSIFWKIAAFFAMITGALCFFGLFLLILVAMGMVVPVPGLQGINPGVLLLLDMVFMIGFGIFIGTAIGKKERSLKGVSKDKWYVLYFNPISISIYWPIRLVVDSIKFAKKNLPMVCSKTAEFVVMVYKLIRSKKRLICLFSTALGVAVIHFTGSMLVGVITAGILGLSMFSSRSVSFKDNRI